MTLLPAVDALNNVRNISCSEEIIGEIQTQLMRCYDYNICTYHFSQSTSDGNGHPSGVLVTNPPTPWNRIVVSAHANTLEVVNFLRDELDYDELDDKGMLYESFVNYSGNGAFCYPISGKFVYGQKLTDREATDKEVFHYASSIGVVAHEIFHSVTYYLSKLESKNQSGALNESYSDIFGVILSNRTNPDIMTWDWVIGVVNEVNSSFPIRDLSNPERFGHPALYENYVDTVTDKGGVHINNGIHNKAAYYL
jgi:Zn-dependent metalloprotease